MNPQRIEALENELIIKIAAGRYFAVALTNTGKVFSWGKGTHGQLGYGLGIGCEDHLTPSNAEYTTTPRCIEALTDKVIIEVSTGDAHVLAIAGE